MRKLALITLLTMNGWLAFAQENCSNPHSIFKMPTDQTPKTITRLNVDPQFPSISHSSSTDQVYNGLKALGSSPQHMNEINSLFNSLGYKKGVNDPAFTRDDVTAANLPYGAVGMMGDAKNQYHHAILMLPNRTTIPAWKINAKSAEACDLYVLNDCGNSFYYSNAPKTNVVVKRETVVEYGGNAKLKVKVFARTKVDCEWCGGCEKLDPDGDGEATVLLMEQDVNQIPVTRPGSSYPEKVLYIDVDPKTMKKIQKEGNVNISYKPSRPDNLTATKRSAKDDQKLARKTK